MLSFRRHRAAVLGGAFVFAAAGLTGAAAGWGNPHDPSLASMHATNTFRVATNVRTTAVRVGLIRITDTSTVQPGAFNGLRLTCPRRYPHTVSGLFDSGSDKVVLTMNRAHPLSSTTSRSWVVGVTNFGDQRARWIAGVVCARY